MKFKFFLIVMLMSLQTLGQDKKSSGKLNLSGMVTNVNGLKQSMFSYDYAHTLKYKKIDFTASSNYMLSYKDGKKYQDDNSLRIQPRLITNNWSIFAFGQASRAYSRKLDSRLETGFGGGHNLIKGSWYTVTASYGILYESSNYSNDTNISALRHSPRLQFFGKADKFSYFTELFYQPMTRDLSNHNYRATTEIKYALNDKLSLSTTYKRWYESYNISGVQGLIENFIIGATFSY